MLADVNDVRENSLSVSILGSICKGIASISGKKRQVSDYVLLRDFAL